MQMLSVVTCCDRPYLWLLTQTQTLCLNKVILPLVFSGQMDRIYNHMQFLKFQINVYWHSKSGKPMMWKVLSVLHGSASLKIFIEMQKLFHDDDIFPSRPPFQNSDRLQWNATRKYVSNKRWYWTLNYSAILGNDVGNLKKIEKQGNEIKREELWSKQQQNKQR